MRLRKPRAAAQVLEAPVDRFGRAVAGAGPLEVSQEVAGSALEGPPERDQLGQGRGDTGAECAGGRAVIVELGPDPVVGPPPTVFVRKEASIIGSYASSRTSVERLVALAASGALDLARSITHVFPSTSRTGPCASYTARTGTRSA